jgi:hypothetical protein
MSAVGQGGASIDQDMYIIRNGSETGYGTEHTFYGVSSNTFTFSAQDSNGNVTQKTLTPTMVDYIKLTCNAVETRPDASGNMSVECKGSFFNGNFGRYVNDVSVVYRYKKSGGSWSGWINMTVSKSGNSYLAYASLSGLDYQASYSFEFNAMDDLMSVTATSSNVRSLPVFHWGENNVCFEVPVIFNQGTEGASIPNPFEGDLQITGNLRLKGSGAYGNKLLLGDSEYCYIGELTDDVMTIKASSINLLTNNLMQNGAMLAFPEYDYWLPTLSVVGGLSYTTQEGWYCKVGNIVTAGFFIKGTVRSGYDGEPIEIYGLPYDPAYAAAGGGMCSGALITTNKNFQCFVAETSGIITTRAQACDSTDGTNLATSASAILFPASGTLALAGTISYVTA